MMKSTVQKTRCNVINTDLLECYVTVVNQCANPDMLTFFCRCDRNRPNSYSPSKQLVESLDSSSIISYQVLQKDVVS